MSSWPSKRGVRIYVSEGPASFSWQAEGQTSAAGCTDLAVDDMKWV